MKSLFLTTLSLILSLNFFAQTIAVTEKEDSIVVYDNGTWKPIKSEVKTIELLGSVKATVEVDEFNNSKIIRTNSWIRFGRTSSAFRDYMNGSIWQSGNLIIIKISYSGDLGCLSKHTSTLKIKLTNGEIIECYQMSKTDCGDFPSALFIPAAREQRKDPDYVKIREENLRLLATYDWEKMRLDGSKYYIDILPRKSIMIPNPEQFFRQHLSAIYSK